MQPLDIWNRICNFAGKKGEFNMESVVCIVFIVFVVARALFGKDDGNDTGKKYPPTYY